MERATYTSKSFLIALALVQKYITAEEAALASHVEVNSQIEKWGEVEDCKKSFSGLYVKLINLLVFQLMTLTIMTCVDI